jgi:predicted dithiol-disulfide oxidoreductase (DUF899 family)
MNEFVFPNESEAYRAKRNELLDEEVRLRAHIEAVAAKRRELPPGGQLNRNYVFQRMDDNGAISEVSLEALFGRHEELVLYTMMFGPDWDAPCPSCTSIVDSIAVNALGVKERAGLAVVSAARPQQLHHWARRRGWRHLDVVCDADSGYVIDYAGFATDDPSVVSAMNVFRKTPDGIYHFWSSELVRRPMDSGHPRHADMIWPMWNLLDMTPGGRGDAMVPKQDFEHRYFSEHVLPKAER